MTIGGTEVHNGTNVTILTPTIATITAKRKE
jgi:hypothetical protein